MLTVKVKNLPTPNGNTAPTQFEIHTEDGVYFQSYETVIAFEPKTGPTVLDTGALHYSRTTTKYLNIFLGTNTREIKEWIADGRIVLKELN